MARWKYNLNDRGAALREAINGGENMESCRNVLNALKSCLDYLKETMPEDDYDYFFSEVLEDAEITEFDGEQAEWEAIEQIDFLLSEFYDACDAASVWIAL